MSRLLIIATALAAAVAFAASMPGAAVTPDRRPPTAPLVVGARTTTNASPAYRFSARDNRTPARALRFRCAFDSPTLRACPRVYRAQLTLGRHVLRVQALDRAGNHGRTSVVKVLVLPALSPAHVLATVAVADPGRMTFAADGSLWVNRKARSTDGTPVNGTVSRIDPATNRVTGTVKVADGGGTGIGFGFGSVWAVNFTSASVSRIDPATGVLLATIPTGPISPPVGVAFTSQAVWVAEHEPEGWFVKIDPATNRIINRIAVGEPPPAGGPAMITSAAGSVWGAASGEVVRFDPVGDKVLAEIRPCGLFVAQIATDGSTVWVTCGAFRRPELSRVDSATNKIATAVTADALAQYGLGVYGLAFGGGMLWLSLPCGDAACVLAIDPASNTIAKAWTVPVADAENARLALAYGGGSLWITSRDDVLRIDPRSA